MMRMKKMRTTHLAYQHQQLLNQVKGTDFALGKIGHFVEEHIENDRMSKTDKPSEENKKERVEERIHKNSMEEWEARLSVAKAKVSVVDMLVEKHTSGEGREQNPGKKSTVQNEKKMRDNEGDNKRPTRKSELVKVSRPKSLDLDIVHNESKKVNETIETEEETVVDKKEVISPESKLKKKSKSENVPKSKEKVEEDCDIHTLPKIKNVRKRGILKKSKVAY